MAFTNFGIGSMTVSDRPSALIGTGGEQVD
jgi:hypothetical protein